MQRGQKQAIKVQLQITTEKGNAIGQTRHTPERTCIGCRAKRPAQDLLRLSCAPTGEIFPELAGRGTGRGGYVCFAAACLQQALKSGKLSSALKQSIRPPTAESLCEAASLLLQTRLGSILGMAQRAGAVISGATPLHQALTRHHIHFLVLADDIAAKRAEVYRAHCRQQTIPCLTLFSKLELGRLLGKSERSAVGLTHIQFGEQLQTTVDALQGLRSAPEEPGATRHLALSTSL